MLYESLKQSVAQYKENRKRNQKSEQKLIFRWKLVTLALSILLIVLIGLMSQLYKSISELKLYDVDSTYLPYLLSRTQELNSVEEIRYLVEGIQLSKRAKFNKANLLYSESMVSSEKIADIISQKDKLVYIFYANNGASRFGLFIEKAFDFDIRGINEVEIIQPKQLQTSTFFSLSASHKMVFNLATDCSIYRLNDASKQLTLMESISISAKSSNLLNVRLANWHCFGATESSAKEQFASLTNLSSAEQAQTPVAIVWMEIFQLSLVD